VNLYHIRCVRFTGGEPTLWPPLLETVRQIREDKFEGKPGRRIAISTNGSADINLYKALISAGVDDLSISLDVHCAATFKEMARKDDFKRVLDNVAILSGLTYITIGVVVTEQNKNELGNIIILAHKLGVADIRIIPAAQEGAIFKMLPDIGPDLLFTHPILKYRYDNFKKGISIRGLRTTDTTRCSLVLDDITFNQNMDHFPCPIYLRENGPPIDRGSCNNRHYQRKKWFFTTNTSRDKICSANCLDVCREFNNRCGQLRSNIL
jgi:MoaA/NifB/PqqE/SkfB family radical SAM enzyme